MTGTGTGSSGLRHIFAKVLVTALRRSTVCNGDCMLAAAVMACQQGPRDTVRRRG